MERFLKALKEFLGDSKGNKSSKRLGWLISLMQLLIAFWVALLAFLYRGEYNLALDLFDSLKWAVVVMGGFVIAEHFKKK